VSAYLEAIRSGAPGALTVEDAAGLSRIVTERRPRRCLEIGMAHGVASLAILEATGGTLVSVDPNQTAEFGNIGSANVVAAGWADRHELVEEPDYLALPALLRRGERFDFVFVDGWHSFDHVVLDLFYADKLLETGGVIGFDDCQMPATRRALRFLQTHKPYQELPVLPPRYEGATAARRLLRRALGWSSHDRWFQKLRDAPVPWDFYRHF